MTEDELKRNLKSNQENTLFKIYDLYKPEFLQFATRFALSKEEVLDVYQDAFIALHENARKGKLDDLKTKIKTYLFAIGKYMIYNKLKQDKKSVYMESIDEFQWDDSFMEEEKTDNSSVKNLEQALNQLGGKCKELLTHFYYEEKKLDEIVLLMNYENKDVAKSQKSRCIKNLKNLLNK